jgi:hypothetical protein
MSDIVWTNPTRRRYHRTPVCASVHRDPGPWQMTATDAVAQGILPCAVCKAPDPTAEADKAQIRRLRDRIYELEQAIAQHRTTAAWVPGQPRGADRDLWSVLDEGSS